MRSKKKWRWYCDHCKKSTGTEASMIKHEKGCTNNPNRVCGMCSLISEWVCEDENAPLLDLIELCKRIHNQPQLPYEDKDYGIECGNEKEIISAMKKVTNCPACMLAAIRQSGIMEFNINTNPHPAFFGECFDYKKESEEIMKVANNNRNEEFRSHWEIE